MEMLIKRDRNRPGVIMWSLGNEEMHHVTDEGRRINKTMIAHAKKLDKHRYTTSAVSISPDVATVYDDLDLVGINYNHWLYDEVRKKYPDKPIFSSECCATGTTTTCTGAMAGGRTRPLSSPWHIMTAPIRRVVQPQEVWWGCCSLFSLSVYWISKARAKPSPK